MINFQEPIQEPRTLDFRYASIKKEPGEANTKKCGFLYAGFYCIHDTAVTNSNHLNEIFAKTKFSESCKNETMFF